MTWLRRSVLGLSLLFIAAAPVRAQRPAAIFVEPRLSAIVAESLETSQTFRHQWDRISAERMVVVYVYLGAPVSSTRRARTDFRRYSSGLLHAVVEIPPDDDYVELLAHEFEHVIEQIERVDLARLAKREASGVKVRPDGAFETVRAQRAGISAALEADAYAAAHPEKR